MAVLSPGILARQALGHVNRHLDPEEPRQAQGLQVRPVHHHEHPRLPGSRHFAQVLQKPKGRTSSF